MRKLTNSIGALWLRFIRLLSGVVCRVVGHRVEHEAWECYHPDYWHPEIDERFWCSRCDEDL